MLSTDFLIVGAGFSGLVIAERLIRRLGKTCIIVDSRSHIGGNSYDCVDENGVLIHKYGPHYFRTNSLKIRDYLTQFTDWRAVEYKILSFTEGRYWNFPINLNTFEQLIGRPSCTEEMELWLQEKSIKIDKPKNSEEVIISQVGWELYEKFFKGYTIKQWNLHPKDLDPSVCGRIPIRTNRDDRYLREEFQAIPSLGYTAMFKNMVRACGENLRILLNTEFRSFQNECNFKHLIYTGKIDEYFNYCFGHLPYRSLRFESQHFRQEELQERVTVSGKSGFWQPAMQVNYPGIEPFTRVVEIKHATGQVCSGTTIVREFPEAYRIGGDAYYPVPNDATRKQYEKYRSLATAERNVSFIGRLATYRYYNMDQVVGMALSEFERISSTPLSL